MLDERHAVDNEPIEEADNVQIGDVVVDKVGFKDVEIALVMFEKQIGKKT